MALIGILILLFLTGTLVCNQKLHDYVENGI
jgi:hypothetical protein